MEHGQSNVTTHVIPAEEINNAVFQNGKRLISDPQIRELLLTTLLGKTHPSQIDKSLHASILSAASFVTRYALEQILGTKTECTICHYFLKVPSGPVVLTGAEFEEIKRILNTRGSLLGAAIRDGHRLLLYITPEFTGTTQLTHV